MDGLINTLIKEKINELYDVDIGSADPTIWWTQNALATLKESNPYRAQVDRIVRCLPVNLLALAQIEWAATKIVALRAAVPPVLEQFFSEPSSQLPHLDEFKASLKVIVVGSLGRFEGTKEGDLDINIVADVGELDARHYTDRLVNLFAKPLMEKANEILQDEPKDRARLRFLRLTSEDLRLVCYSALFKSEENFYTATWNNIAAGCCFLIGQPFPSLSVREPDSQVMIEHQSNTRFNKYADDAIGFSESNTRQSSEAVQDVIKHQYKVVVSGLLILSAVRGIPACKWSSCYFRLAELLKENDLLNAIDWGIVQLAVLHCIEFRTVPDTIIGKNAGWRGRDDHITWLVKFARLVRRVRDET